MRKKRAISLLIILLLIIVGTTVNAYTGELDPESYITLPASLLMIDYKSTATISVNVSGYDIYYQKIDMTESAFNSFNDKSDKFEKYVKDSTEELQNKKDGVTELEEAYSELLRDAVSVDSTVTEEELNEAKTKYETALEEYNEALESAKAEREKLRKECMEVIPTFTSSWTKTTNGSDNLNLDFTGYSGKVYFVLWAKIENGTNTYYECDIYSNEIKASGSEEQENVTNIMGEADKRNEVVDNTQADGKLPQTGYNMLMGISVILVIGFAGFVSYCKTKKYDL